MDRPDDAAHPAASSARDPQLRSRTHVLPALAAVVAFGSAWWLATPCRAPLYRIVSYADLDLSDPADFRLLTLRLDRAATAVCAAGQCAAGGRPSGQIGAPDGRRRGTCPLSR